MGGGPPGRSPPHLGGQAAPSPGRARARRIHRRRAHRRRESDVAVAALGPSGPRRAGRP